MSALAASIAQDARELRRGVLVTYVGYLFKLAMPLLLALATRAYGVQRWGLFLTAQAAVLIAARVCLLGLDKGILWSVAARGPEVALVGVRPALLRVALTAGLGCAALSLWPSLGLVRIGAEEAAALRITAIALPPYALSELLLHAAMGRRRMELQVAIRETISPLAQVVVALLLFRLGLAEIGLACAFVVAQLLSLTLAWLGFVRLFARTPWPIGESFALAPGLFRYAGPLWVAEMANTLALRLDTLVLASLTDPVTVGVWGIVGQFANALRQIRRAYDPIVTALSARIAVQHETARLSATFSYAAQMVSLAQLPLFVLLLVFADLLLPLYGAAFAVGTTPLIVLAGFFLLSGGTGLAGLVVSGYGRSVLTLANVLASVLLQLALLLWLVPLHGLLGAAIAVGLSLCLVNMLQLIEMRAITGSFHYTPRSRFSLWVVTSSCSVTALSWWLARTLELGSLSGRVLMVLSFALVYGGLCTLGLRKGLLRAPDASLRRAADGGALVQAR
jgi:O-antigen/teichoic acid export membrane protein